MTNTNVKSILDSNTQRNVDLWLKGDYDEKTKAQIRHLMESNPKELIDSFYTTLAFGTGGMRGIMGVGSNRINQYTIRAATQGLANYINKQPVPQQGHAVFIGYDSRNQSRFFAEEAAKVLLGNNIKVFLCKELRPTPFVSFGCRYHQCTAGIMITASHNPKEYNGYKVYWSDGGQVLPPHDKDIIEEFKAIRDMSKIKSAELLYNPMLVWVNKDVDDAYIKAIEPLQNYPEQNHAEGYALKVIYTSLHGTGITLMPQALAAWGFKQINLVDAQTVPDGNFPTVKVPNPEYPETLKLGILALEETKGDILIATDPDADRIAVAVRHRDTIEFLNGNQIACICLAHICQAMHEQNALPENAAFIKTIVTTELFQAICNDYKRPCFNVLTGFKYIAQKIHEWETESNGFQYIFGGEESYGYLYGTQTRDKDAILSGALICEIALQAKLKGMTLIDVLHDIYHRYGVYYEKLISLDFEESKAGHEMMSFGMEKLRQSPPLMINGVQVKIIEDYERSIKYYCKTDVEETVELPKSNVLVFWLEDGSKVMVRPSGTEPKVKMYCGVVIKDKRGIAETLERCEERATGLLADLKSYFLDADLISKSLEKFNTKTQT